MSSSFEERRSAIAERHDQGTVVRGGRTAKRGGWSWSGFFIGIAISAFAFHGVTGMGDVATWASEIPILAPHAPLVAAVVSGLIGIAFVYVLIVASRTAIPLGLAGFNTRSPRWPRRGSMFFGILIGVVIGAGPDRVWEQLVKKLSAMGLGA